MKQTFLSILLMLLPMLASADAVQIGGIWYNLIPKAKEAEVTSNPNKYSGDVVIPPSVTYNGEPYKVTSIGESAFSGCTSLTSVTIGNSVTSIGEAAFYGCSGLTSITIPNSVIDIGKSAFSGCNSLTSVTIPNSVTSIGYRAFYGCSRLPSVTIPNNVTYIGSSAFENCSGLTSVIIGKSVTSIGNDAFYGCESLTSVHISEINAWCGIIFETLTSNPLYYAHHLYMDGEEIKDLVIPNSVTSSCSLSFSGCSGLTSVTIPNSVTYLGDLAFFNCSGLTSVTIPNSVTDIGKSAFSGCNSLTSVTIPNSVTYISQSAFSGCTSLTSVTIPNSVKKIDYQAFANCNNLTDVYCLAEKLRNDPYSGEALYTHPDAFDGSYPQAMTLHVPAASISAYQTIEPWKYFKGPIAVSGGTPPPTPTTKCSTPVISYSGGKIEFTCATDGVDFVSSVTSADVNSYTGSTINLTLKFTVSVYATKAGLDNSDEATKDIEIVIGDMDGDGNVNAADIVKLVDKVMNP